MARRRRRVIPIVAISGFSGSGKTRLVTRLVPALARRGLSVSVVKHTGHDHSFDVPGKDTHAAREAGAVSAAILGPAGVAYFGPPVKGLRALAALGPAVDLVLAEGFKQERVPRVEVHRRCVAREFLCERDRDVFAVVTDESPPRSLPTFGADDVEPLAELLCARLGLHAPDAPRPRRGALPGGAVVRSVAASGRPSAPRGANMAKTTSRKSGARKSGGSRAGARSSATRRGGARGTRSRSAAGRKGGKATLRARGPEFYSEIGRKGGKASGSRRRAGTRAAKPGRTASRSGAGARGRAKRTGRR